MIKGSIYLSIVLFLMTGCYEIRTYRAAKKTKELWSVIPATFDESMSRLDTLFTGVGRAHFKETEESVAVIELYRDKGIAIMDRWHLIPYPDPVAKEKNEHDQYDRFPWLSNHSDLSLFFSQAGINDCTEMVHIIFTCFHRKLNNLDYDPRSVIDDYKSFWVSSSVYRQNRQIPSNSWWRLSDQMKQRQDSIENRYFFKSITENDTMTFSISYKKRYFFPKTIWYNIKGLAEKKDTARLTFSIRIFEIFSSINDKEMKNDSAWNDDGIIRRIGDSIGSNVYHFRKAGEPKFYYR